MSDYHTNDSMLEMYIYETAQNIEQLEACILESEKSRCFSVTAINEIFRMMHTIKGSSAMMLFDHISMLAHSMEDLFYFIRENKPLNLDFGTLSNLILDGIDYIKVELHKIESREAANGDASGLIEGIRNYLNQLKEGNPNQGEDKSLAEQEKARYYISADRRTISGKCNNYKATVYFEDGCEMENIRAYTIIHNLKDSCSELEHLPKDIIENENSILEIREKGFQIWIRTDKTYNELLDILNQAIFLKELQLEQLDEEEVLPIFGRRDDNQKDRNSIKLPNMETGQGEKELPGNTMNQSMISVHVSKLDKLMDLVGELVIAESMVTLNPELKALGIESFRKATSQLHKITNELQDTVMDIRMVPLSMTFHKMNRVIRDMSRKLDKEVELELIGETTEVDKNIIEHISDPIMHLVRNAVDHGIERAGEREERGKERVGKITLEAKNAGSDVLIFIRDDGKGLCKEKILQKARENGLLTRSEEDMTEKEIFNLIFLPGFSTKEEITEFSGRGVGMDVVAKNIGEIGGVISVESTEGKGSTFVLKIPLTLAIIDGMNIRVGNAHYTIPTTSIRESFRPNASDIINDPDGNEMIMMRGRCYPILRLHELYKVKTSVKEFTEGIFIRVEQEEAAFCIFADQLLGQQQVVVKTLPNYIKRRGNIRGLAGCTLLGDGSISLILDIAGLFHT